MRLMRIAAALALAGTVVSSQASPIPAAWWAADGDASDSVAARDGALINGAGFDTGVSGQAFRLDGANDYVEVPDDPLWTLGSGDFSLSVWANFDTVKSASLGQVANTLLGHDTGAGTTNKWIFFFDDAPDGSNTGNLAFHINGWSSGSVFLTSPSAFTVIPGAWHHFALTRDAATSTYAFYADGTLLGTRTDSRAIPDTTAPLTIGQAEGLGYFDGRLDEVRIYDLALSAAQVAALGGSGVAVPEPATLLLALGALLGMALRRRRTG